MTTMKRLLFIICLLFVANTASSQIEITNVNTIDKRCGKIINKETGERIYSEDLMLLLDEEAYKAYSKGRTLHIVSIPFWCETASSAALAATSFIMAHKMKNTVANNNSEEFSNGLGFAIYYAGGIILSLSTAVFAVPSTVLTICSNAKLKKAVNNYNNTTPEISLNFGATSNGIGLMLKF